MPESTQQQPDGQGRDGALITGIIADDMTGGVLVASSLVEQGIACPVVTRPSALAAAGEAPACVIAGRFRLAPAAEAVRWFDTAQKALTAAGARHVIYKYCATFDSTDDGNIGPCADALMRHAGVDRLGFSTAFPEVGVTVYQGHIFHGAKLLCDSHKRFDPITPMPDPNLVEVLGRQTAHRVALVPHAVLAQGAAATRRFIDDAIRQGAVYFLFDGVDAADIAACAEVTQAWPAMTGGDTLLAALPARQIAARQEAPAPPRLPEGHTAIIAGSCAEATLRQLARFEERRPVRRIALADAAVDFDAARADACAWAERALASGPIALSVADEPEGVKRIQAALGVEPAKALAERLCAELARALRGLNVNRFIVAGGETSGVVADALGMTAMRVYPQNGVPGGFCVDEPERRICCYFKAGKMGSETIFPDLVEIFDRTFQADLP